VSVLYIELSLLYLLINCSFSFDKFPIINVSFEEIIFSDIFNLKKTFFGSECVIFISNLLFPKETTHKIIKFLNDNVKKDTIIFLTVIPSELYDFQIVDRIETPMSWSSDSKCYVLKKNS